jgi:predicted ribosome quality control (RQC) complex YloA/Tae2 family protein
MPFDGFTIHAICHELDRELCNARIDKIYQPEKDEIVMSIRTPSAGTTRLVLSANPRWARLHLSSEKRANPTSPPSFCMLLRKYLEGGKIKEIRQVGFERIVHITIEALDEFRDWKPRRLIMELMGKHSNIILINPENGVIIDAIKRYGSEVSSYREVFPGREYKTPPDQGKVSPLTLNLEQFAAGMWAFGSQTLSQSLFQMCSGISTFAARELCHQVHLDPNIPVEQCGEYEFKLLLDAVLNQLSKSSNPPCPAHVIYKDVHVMDFTPLMPSATSIQSFPSANQAADYFYQAKMSQLRLESMQTNLSRTIKGWIDKAQKKRFFQEGDLVKAREKEQLKTWGELLTVYAHQLNKGDKEAHLEDFHTGQKVTIELDPRLTPIANAQKYYKAYNKSRIAIKHLESYLQQTIEEIEYLESVLLAVNQAENLNQLDEIVEELEKGGYLRERKVKSKEKVRRPKSTPRRFVSSDGLEILVGRNNRQNDQLTLKTADRNDLWLHTRQIPGSHVIIRLPRTITSIDEVPQNSLEEAALLAAYFSKARQDNKVPVDYTFRSNVRKPGGAKPGMVIYDNYWTLYTDPGTERLQAILQTVDKEEDLSHH